MSKVGQNKKQIILETSHITCSLKIQKWSREPRVSYSCLKSTAPCQDFVHKDSESKNVSVIIMYTKASLEIYGVYTWPPG